MIQMKAEEVKELLRQVPCPGRSRDIVALGFVKKIAIDDEKIFVSFMPDTVHIEKVLKMEEDIRTVLHDAHFDNIELETEPPYDDTSMMLGGASTNPLQIDLAEYGLQPTGDILEGPGRDAKPRGTAKPVREGEQTDPMETAAAADVPTGEGPQGNVDPTYDGPLSVFQWQIDPASAGGAGRKIKLSIGSWNFVVCWLDHPAQDLVYASLQARHWLFYDGKARPNPAGRTE
ncbi:MAG: iron-sulfur cluster assembly protein, partial [Rhodocyclaceae bacterium]